MSALLTTNSTSIKIVLIYCPPQSNHLTFLREFEKLLEILCSSSDKFFIMGDFNIHVDSILDGPSRRFTSLTESFGVVKHVSEPTHIGGHILDLILSRSSDNLISRCVVDSIVSDQFVVPTVLKAHRTPLKTRPMDYR